LQWVVQVHILLSGINGEADDDRLCPAERREAMTLKEKLRAARAAIDEDGGQYSLRGFHLTNPTPIYFRESPAALLDLLKNQQDNTAHIDGEELTSDIGLAGEISGTPWRLTKAAFSDLCHFTKTPVSFIKRLAKIDETQAVDTLRTMIDAYFHTASKKLLVIDSSSGYVLGIVGKETYKPLSNVDLVNWGLSSGIGLGVSEAWVNGPNLRVTFVSETLNVKPCPNDIVQFGMALENWINGDGSAKASDYALRLVCTNGMTARVGGHTNIIRHTGDVQMAVQKAIVASSKRAKHMAPAMKAAATMYLDDEGIRQVRSFIRDGKNGGSQALDNKVTKIAQVEAQKEGREEFEVSLWNFVNGTTEVARDTKSIERKVEIESLAYKTLARYAVEVK